MSDDGEWNSEAEAERFEAEMQKIRERSTMTDKKKSAPVYLQIREDGRIQAVLEDGTPLKAQVDVVTHSSARTGGVEAKITLMSAGWLPSLEREGER